MTNKLDRIKALDMDFYQSFAVSQLTTDLLEEAQELATNYEGVSPNFKMKEDFFAMSYQVKKVLEVLDHARLPTDHKALIELLKMLDDTCAFLDEAVKQK